MNETLYAMYAEQREAKPKVSVAAWALTFGSEVDAMEKRYRSERRKENAAAIASFAFIILASIFLPACGMMQSLPDAEALYRECLTLRGSADVTVSVGSGIFTPSRMIRSSCTNDEAVAASFRQPTKRVRAE